MFKLIILALGLAVGFGGGVWYGVQHPEWAKDFAAREEAMVLEAKLKIAKATKAKLDEVAARDAGKTPGGASSFVGGGGAKSAEAGLARVRQENDAEIADLEKKLAEVKK